MKNIKVLFVIFLGFFVCLLGGCENGDAVSGISIKGNTIDTPFEICAGDVNYSDYVLLVEYESGKIEEVKITEEMIDDEDEINLFKVGNQEVNVSYKKKTTTMYFVVSDRELKDIYLPDLNVVYTGEDYEVKVEGNLPKNAVVIYPYGNTFREVGSYTLEAIVYENGYAVKTLESKVVINKATYDMSGVSFNDMSYVYDGTPKMINVLGELPKGVTVRYEFTGNLVDVGVYEITAIFSGDYNNYEVISEMKATLTITKARYNLDGIKFVDETFVYDGNPHSIFIVNEELLPEGVEVIYTNNGQVDAGVYEVVASFNGDGTNYEVIEELYAELIIEQATFDMSEVRFDSALFKYDETVKQIEVVGELPEGVSVSYEVFSSDLEISYAGFPSEVGTYVVVARFNHDNSNYLPIENMIAIIIIES